MGVTKVLKLRVFLATIISLSLSNFTYAKVSGYSTLNQNQSIEHHIDKVLLLAGITVASKPIAISVVAEAVNKYCTVVPDSSCIFVRDWLKRNNQDTRSFSKVTASPILNSESGYLANMRGVEANSNIWAQFQSSWLINDTVALNIGVQGSESSGLTPEDSYLSLGFDWGQFDIGYKPHWWSPFKNGAMLISSHAPTFENISLSSQTSNDYLNFKYELFLGRLSESKRILTNNELVSGKPILTGVHISFEPFDGLRLSVNRVMQSGGRGESFSINDLFDAFISPSTSDNTSSDLSFDEQFGNQVASISSVFTFSGERPFSVYFEYGGEDTNSKSNARLGNTTLSAGVFVPNLIDNLDVRYEWTEWLNSWYVHSVYKDGLTNDNVIIGHWGAAQRVYTNNAAGDGVGGNQHYLQAQYLTRYNSSIEATLSYISNENYTAQEYSDGYSLGLSWYSAPGYGAYSVSATSGRNTLSESFFSLSLSW